ncbi:MAG: hypothetical protein ABR599_11565 [Gemmatimonadota bacterium]
MRQLLGIAFVYTTLAFAACQQTQEADEDADGTTVIEEETVVQPAPPPADEPDVQMDVEVQGGEEGASGEVRVEDN